ncbi:MAG: O-methyltransferase, partial [Steroidobacteraceae bacterium]
VESTGAANIPPIQISPTQGKFLMVLARAVGARRILEIGTLGGYSTIWLARALPAGGRLISCEIKPSYAEVARANLQRAGVAEVAEIRVGRASDTLAKLIAEHAAPFDLVFIDADKSGYPDYLTASLKLSRPGTVIVADNVVRDGRVADPGNADPDIRGLRRYIEMVGAEPRLSATALQTVGEKGYDGFALALVGSG